MGNQEENVLLRFEGEDAGASSTLEELVALMQDAVVSVDELIAAGYKMSDINEALDLIAGGASAASESIGELGTMTKEAALALGQANDILNTGAEKIDTFAKDSLSGAEALGALGQQTSALSKEMDTAWFEVDQGVDKLDELRNAAVGADAVFSSFDNQIGLYDEMMSSANDRTNAFTSTVTSAKESSQELAQTMHDAATADRTFAEGVNFSAEAAYAQELRTRELAISLGYLTEAFDADRQAMDAYAAKMQAILDASSLLGDGTLLLAEHAESLIPTIQDVAAAEEEGVTAANDLGTATADLTTSFKGTEAELATLIAMFSGASLNIPGLVQAGYDIEKVQEALQKLIETGDATVAAMTLTGQSVMDAFGTNTQALLMETQAVSDYLAVLERMSEGMQEAVTAGFGPMDQAIADATTTYNELDDASATAAYEVQAVGTESETAGEKVSGANESFGGSQYLLMQLGFMAYSAAQQFYQLGVTAQNTLAIIQGKTGASDAQMQQWTTTLENMGVQGGYTLDEMAQGFELVNQAQFKGNDGITVLQASMELARASGEKLTDSTNLLAMSLDAFGAKASDAHTYAAILFDALANGKQNMQELTSALGPVIGEAAHAGIGFNDLVTAETNFSHSTNGSMEGIRQFQSLIMALAGDTQLTADQLAKLGLAFDQTKFQTLDFAGKLEYLAQYSNGNVKAFIAMVGGMKDVQSTMHTLGISTKTLAKNAEDLGLSFDPVKYKAMDAGDKLYYLLQVSGYNEAEFKKLTTGGVNPLNDALEKLDLKTNDVAAKAKQMGLNFDEAKFSTDTLTQKLWDLWDASGHNIDKFGQLIGGTKNVGAAFDTMGLQADGTSKKQDNLGQTSDTLGNKHLSPLQKHLIDLNQTMDDTDQKHLSPLQKHLIDLNQSLGDQTVPGTKTPGPNTDDTQKKLKQFDDSYHLTAKDIKANNDQLTASFSNLSLSVATALGSSGLGNDIKWLADQINYLATQTHAAESFVNGFITMFIGPTQAILFLINLIGQLATIVWNAGTSVGKALPQLMTQMWDSIVGAFSSGGQSVEDAINGFINWLLSKFHFLDFQLVGGSIIPDMIDAIVSWFEQLPTRAMTAVNNMVTQVTSSLGGLGAKAIQWGEDMVNGFITGINNELGNLGTAASNIAKTIAGYLHHSTPDLGPMAGDDQWMPDFINLLISGLDANVARLTHASSQIAQSLIPPVGLSTSSPFASQQSVAPIVTVLNQILAVLQSGQSGQTGSGAPPSVTLNNFGGGSTNVGQIASQLDQLSGIRFEAGLRGGF